MLIFGWIITQSGLFEEIFGAYRARGLEETGRGLVWPVVIERIFTSPIKGVGVSNLASYIPEKGKFLSPHNGFLFLALASGIIPLACYVAYWTKAVLGALRARTNRLTDAPFYLPLVIYAFLITLATNAAFMMIWVVVILSSAVAASELRQGGQRRRKRPGEHLMRRRQARYAVAGG